TGTLPGRLHKLLDCLESLGFVQRTEDTEDLLDTTYRPVPGVREAAVAVLGPDSIERDRDRYAWRRIHGRLPEVLRGELSVPEDDFAWPPSDEAQIRAFERSMAAGLGPIVKTFRAHARRLLAGPVRLLDVGGGDGTLAAHLLDMSPGVRVDVYNLPRVRHLVEDTARRHGHMGRLGFVPGDFLNEPLPTGYHAMSFVRVLHDWPTSIARRLVSLAYSALPPGGRIMICEEFRTDDRLAAQFFWSYFLIGVDSCVSRLREIDYYVRTLHAVGFHEIEVLPGPFELVTAIKPTASAGL
ncbi:MAG TPA: methyltransferase, partial [Micromonosporaceae bacterium]